MISRLDYHGFFHLGGPVEEKGRLRYIDGCTDSLLIPPTLSGDACLNLLHLPPHTCQTPHTHPSLRVGLIIRGRGHCLTDEGRIPLDPGQAFVIRAGDCTASIPRTANSWCWPIIPTATLARRTNCTP